VKTLLFGNDQRLMGSYVDAVQPGQKVWQAAHVYGDLIQRVATKLGPTGELHLTDVSPVQVDLATRKLAPYKWAKAIHADASLWDGAVEGTDPGRPYDLVCSFFLLHEVPDDLKGKIVDRMLALVPPTGQALFVDYHRPAAWQPVRPILQLVNRYLEPYADTIWRREIQEFATEADRFTWQKRTLFGDVYQIVHVRPKARPVARA
jgi:hypothetical protein